MSGLTMKLGRARASPASSGFNQINWESVAKVFQDLEWRHTAQRSPMLAVEDEPALVARPSLLP